MKNKRKTQDTKWVKTRISIEDYKTTYKMAIDEDISLAELLRRAIKVLVEKG